MFALDTHVHTCLSPCGDLDMHPAGLVRAAVSARLDGVAVCDHNSAENVEAVIRAGEAAGLAVIPGLEVTSEEEVHVLALLPDLDAAAHLQETVYAALPGANAGAAFGQQVVADEHEEVLGFCPRLLAGATTLSVERVVDAIHAAGGLAVAAHVDREGFGIIGQLGMIPEGLGLDALEVSSRTALPEARRRFSPGGEYALLCASDAHEPRDVGRAVTYMLLDRPDLEEIRKALSGSGGRAILGGGRPMEDLALHILDVARNGAEAGATLVEIELVEDPAADLLSIEVKDNGSGMDAKGAALALDPFYTSRTTRRVGLGLPLLAQAARASGGGLEVDSAPGRGTRVRARFRLGHVDRAPIGDLETTLLVLLAGAPGIDLVFRHAVPGREFVLDSRDLREVLDGGSLCTAEGLAFAREVIRRGESGLAADGLGPSPLGSLRDEKREGGTGGGAP